MPTNQRAQDIKLNAAREVVVSTKHVFMCRKAVTTSKAMRVKKERRLEGSGFTHGVLFLLGRSIGRGT